jgi:LmbE family N-acetylglucosaminyl deacetylase
MILHRPRNLLASLICGMAVFSLPFVAQSETNSPAAILQQLKSFREMGSVLYIAAHPDDENTLLIAYLARGKNYRTAYLSLTRGDGGQNVLGPDFGEKLGVARTQELLAARRLDGGQQFFSRAMDFGFSKDYHETLRIWDRQEVLSDMVRVIREFRPDVLITRFSPVPGGTHGHHTASTVLALEAFKLAGDPKAFPEQQLPPWQPKRILWNGRGSGETNADVVQMEISGNDPVLGISFGELAARSRAMHKTQGFDNFRGFGGGNGARTEYFQLLDGETATNDILDGVDTTWNRIPGGAEIGQLADEIISQFNPQDAAASVSALLKLKSELAALPANDSVVAEKRVQLDRILQNCLGLEIETTIANAEVVPGEKMQFHHSAIVHSSVPVRWLGVSCLETTKEFAQPVELGADESSFYNSAQILPTKTPLTQPYWLREEGTPGMFHVDDASLVGRPENPPAFPIEQIFEVGGQTLVIPDEAVQILTNSANKEIRRKLDVIPPVALKFSSDVELFSPGKSHSVEIEILAARANSAGTLQLEAPADWKISPAQQSFSLAAIDDRQKFNFTVTAPEKSTTAKIIANAKIGGVRYCNARDEISYPHIPRQLLQPVASTKAVSLDLVIRGHTVGYLPGAGDSIAENLKQMGYAVKVLGDIDLSPENLRNLDAVVIGVRAFNVRTNLVQELPALFDYVENGGTVVAQYNRPDGLKTDKIAPFDLHLSGERVTDETAAMTFLAPDHPALNSPNKITGADFDGWIQERGIYFPNQWNEHFTPILACNDPGEAPLKGALLVAQYGKGYYVYTGLDFFRELPAGVPGAYRLFANLISLGK